MSSVRKINATKDYGLFVRSRDNRPTDVNRRKKLVTSMKMYGWLPCFPMVCVRNGNKALVVKDGQHRLEIAEGMNLTVYWVEHDNDFDVAVTAAGQKPWIPRDYAQCYDAKGHKSYHEGLQFSEQYSLPIGVAFALLAGHTSYSNIEVDFVSGRFKVKDREWADAVAELYSQITELASSLKTANFIGACMAVCRTKAFSPKRLIEGAKRCRDKLVPYSTRDAYLDLMETLYNYGRQSLSPLKIDAVNAMRERNAVNHPKPKPAAGE